VIPVRRQAVSGGVKIHNHGDVKMQPFSETAGMLLAPPAAGIY